MYKVPDAKPKPKVYKTEEEKAVENEWNTVWSNSNERIDINLKPAPKKVAPSHHTETH